MVKGPDEHDARGKGENITTSGQGRAFHKKLALAKRALGV